MASLTRDGGDDKRPGWRVQFFDTSGKRRSVRLGRMAPAAAETIRDRITALVATRLAGGVPDAETTRWLSGLGEALHTRLARVGLVEARVRVESVSLSSMLAAFFAVVDVKASTRVRMEQARTALVKHFGANRRAASITEGDAEAWRAAMKDDGYAPATIARTVLYARQMFRWGMRRKLVDCNPFAELRAGAQTNAARQVFVDRDTIAKVIDAAPDAEWRLLIALSRFGGLRVPSEALALTWQDVDWGQSRIRVPSPKTEHHEGGESRIIPIFPELRPHLEAAFLAAPEGSLHVINRYRRSDQNLGTQLKRIIRKAGVGVWPKVWHNLRASRQTELAASFPLATACAWIGNSKAIASGHYLQVTDGDWERATRPTGAAPVQNPAQQEGAGERTKDHTPDSDAQTEVDAGVCASVQDGEWAIQDSNL